MSERRDRIRRIRRDRRREARKHRNIKKSFKIIFSWIFSILAAAILGYGIVTFLIQTSYMVGSSMKPTLENGDRCFVNKFSYTVSKPDRYDVVLYRLRDNDDKYYDIKRVIGLPGETVLIEDGAVYVDGKKLTDMPVKEYIVTAGLASSEITLADDEYFLLGDNINNSIDSRFDSVGNVSKAEIHGKVIIH